ncbi:MAG: putative transposase [Psychromonas sp.]|jgi:ACT domain-containing protein|tara:strand:+ start:161 stop:463 length:303 start_codon:yes stop_codon:yes gene_type:complete
MQTNRTQQWLDLIRRQPGSGLNIQDFCQQNNLATSTFYKYRKQLTAQSSFSKVTIKTEQTRLQEIVEPAHITLTLQVGELKLPGSTSAQYLSDLIRGLVK